MSEDRDLPQPAEVTPAMRGGIWSARRQSLFAVLAARDETVADLYRRAVDALGERPLTPGALVVASHCIRELANRLPRVLGEVVLPEYQSERPAAEALDAALTEAGFDIETSHDEEDDGDEGDGSTADGPAEATASPDDMVLVPRTVLDAVRVVVNAHRGGSSRAHEMRSALVLGAAQAGGSASTLKVVKDAVNAFEKFRHPLGDDLSDWLTRGPDYYVMQLEVIERALDGRLGRFFDVVADLRVLLEKANEQQDGQWVEPDADLVKSALPRLADPQHRRVFFYGLQNPLWVEPLDSHGVFSDPPTHYVDDEGRMPFQQWPQGDYLRAVAPEVPEAVASILARVVNETTAWHVREHVIAVASEVPAGAAAVLDDLIVGCIEDRQVGPHVGTEVVAVVEVLAHGSNSQRKKAKQIAQKLFQPQPKDGSSLPGRFSIGAGIDNHWYDETLDRAVAAFDGSLEILKSLAWWLDREQTLSGTFVPESHDTSSTRRPSVSDHPQNHRFDEVADALIDAVRDTAIALIRKLGHEPVLEVLRSRPAPILTRIELYALSQTVGDTENQDDTVLAFAAERLTDHKLADDYTYHREFHQLAAAALPLVDDTTYTQWEQALLDGPDLDDHARDRIASFYGGNGDPDEAVAAFIERGQLHRLSAVGPDALRERARARYDELVAKHGAIDHPGFLSWHSSGWVGDDPDNLRADLSTMTPEEVLDLLAQPPADDEEHSRGPVSHREALARAFGADVSRRPHAYSTLAGRVLTLDAQFVNRFMSALRELVRNADKAAEDAVDEGGSSVDQSADATTTAAGAQAAEPPQPPEPVNWPTVLAAFEASDVWRETIYDAIEDFGTWRWVREEICSLIEAAARAAIPRELLPAAFDVAAAMTTDSDPTPATEERYGGSNMDPLTHSLNTVRPSAVRALLQIARADTTAHSNANPEGTDGTTSTAPGPLTAPTLKKLTNLLEPERDDSLTIAAVLGEHAGWLTGYGRDWLEEHRRQLMSADPFGDVFVTTALATHNPHPLLIELLTAPIERMLRRAAAGDEITSGIRHDETPVRLIGNHLIGLYLWGRIGLDHPLLVQFHTDAPVAERATVLDQLGWQFSNTADLDDDIKHRAAALWDSRLAAARAGETSPAELAEFESWIQCGQFDVTWWLPRLTELAETFTFDGRAYIGDELEAASTIDLPGTLHALDLLLRAASSSAMFLPFGLRKAAPVVLARALESDDPATVAKADDLLDYIGRQGDLRIQDEVQERRPQQQPDEPIE